MVKEYKERPTKAQTPTVSHPQIVNLGQNKDRQANGKGKEAPKNHRKEKNKRERETKTTNKQK